MEAASGHAGGVASRPNRAQELGAVSLELSEAPAGEESFGEECGVGAVDLRSSGESFCAMHLCCGI